MAANCEHSAMAERRFLEAVLIHCHTAPRVGPRGPWPSQFAALFLGDKAAEKRVKRPKDYVALPLGITASDPLR
jgi:hypothetical protein